MSSFMPALGALTNNFFSAKNLLSGGLLNTFKSMKVAVSTPKPPPIPAPEKPPQLAKSPDRGAAVASNAMAAGPLGALSGNSGTFLTGGGGVDSSSLNLGRNTLLGQ